MTAAIKSGPSVGKKRKYESARQLERRATILTATRELLAEVGYMATTMRGLAERAQVAPGTLYNLYSSKDELLMAAVEDLLKGLDDRAYAESSPGVDRILKLAQVRAESIVNEPRYAEAMTRALYRAEADDPLKTLLYIRSLPALTVELQAAIQNGELLESTNTDIVAKHVQTQNWGVITAWVMGVFKLTELPREYQRSQAIVLAGYATQQGARILKPYL